MNGQKYIGLHLRALLDEMVTHLHKQLEIAGFPEIKPSHGYIFQHISDDGSRITELAAHAKITKQSMSALVYQLEDWGYVKRRADTRDKRGVLFYLTGAGTIIQQTTHKVNFDFERRWESKLGITNYQKFKENLQKLNSIK
ncbi:MULTISPECIES: helix-turn-helix domain-containing protein [unclassified Mucilaginibacter]|uniref:MarR family winged helix-turn-helix transcriptional regulator n=1 Tax=unclassified Mucilaginibacter TaxID=2617802 RepID=UPI002AC8DEFE|nr:MULTISPECIES: helix-turn-helix domain-containing protein [unclassified Mucilaginibacter]MEB0261393.1 helix-turn-helix domain-containing protein [Mucilaginibacter sp. 10I4]MEB0278848.1 helix-turn-helix domain-containing protein [Mucilaginibacter sp. 10B2]MEB0299786.1 helix-turn-helix domain-containing protein [Mucilaginibacter sp. 5C4]WPX22030.1 helix-turn-helix domain-containing protein [Mucilaginibacter sp. 5C4]